MEMGQIFEYPSLPPIKWLVFPASPEYLQYRSETGPGICAPYLFELEWIDNTNVMGIHFSVLGLPDGNLTDSIFANQGGVPVAVSRQIAITITFFWTEVDNHSQHWIEYRIPQGFDSGLSTDRDGILQLTISVGLIFYDTYHAQIDNPRLKMPLAFLRHFKF